VDGSTVMFIYGLYDPVTDDIRYVGLTTKTIEKRYNVHMYVAANKKEPTHVARWIGSLLNQGLKPVAKLLQQCDNLEDLKKAEIAQIALQKSLGANLCNLTIGGDGFIGYKATEEQREKMSKSQLGKKHGPWSEEVKRKLSVANKGVPFTTERRTNISNGLKGKIKNVGPQNPMYGRKFENCPNSISVAQLDLDGNVLRIFPSMTAVTSITGINNSHIGSVCKGKRKTSGGFKWKYLKDLPVAP